MITNLTAIVLNKTNLTMIALNVTVNQPPQESPFTATLGAAAIAAIAALLGVLISSLTYYMIEKNRFENNIRMQVRDERKKVYTELLKELNNIEWYKFYKDFYTRGIGHGEPPLGAEIPPKRGMFFRKLECDIDLITKKFEPDMATIGDLKILEILRYLCSYLYIGYDTDEDNRTIKIKDVLEIEDMITEIKNEVRSELLLKEQKSIWWQFWKRD